MRFWAHTYRLNFGPDFLKLFLKIEKLISFVGILLFFSFGAREQKLCPNKVKIGERGQHKKICKNLNFFLNFFPIDYIFVYLEGFDSFHLDLL